MFPSMQVQIHLSSKIKCKISSYFTLVYEKSLYGREHNNVYFYEGFSEFLQRNAVLDDNELILGTLSEIMICLMNE